MERAAKTGILCGLIVHVALAAPTCAQDGTAVAQTRYYALHSDPWINLHHFLYQWARADLGLGEGRTAVEVPERAEMPSLDDGQRAAWARALDFYRADVAARDHFDRDMLRLKQALVELDGDLTAEPPDDIVGVATALRDAMPVYRARWWTSHDRANQKWIAEVAPLIRENEEGYVTLAVRSFGGTWPETRTRADVSAYANWQGGYTSVRPVHIMVISTSPKTMGLSGMEIAFHEICHGNGIQGTSREDIRDAYRAIGAEPNGNLWHALIFYVSGVYARDVAMRHGEPGYEPHMLRELAGFRGWSGLWEAIDAEWGGVLAGTRDREDALAAVVRRIGANGGSPASTAPPLPVRIDFRPDTPAFDAAAEEYRRLWADRGAEIAYADTAIVARVLEEARNSGYRERPMRLRASYPTDTKLATLVHELGHRLQWGSVTSTPGTTHSVSTRRIARSAGVASLPSAASRGGSLAQPDASPLTVVADVEDAAIFLLRWSSGPTHGGKSIKILPQRGVVGHVECKKGRRFHVPPT